MNDNTGRFFSYLLYFSLIAGVVVLCFNPGPKLPALTLYVAFGGILLYHTRRHRRSSGFWKCSPWFVLLEFILAVSVQYFDYTAFSGFEELIVIATALLSCKLRFSIPFAVIAILASFATVYLKSPYPLMQEFREQIGTVLLPRVFFFIRRMHCPL